MTDDSSVFEGPADEPPAPARDDNPPQTVSELSFALKRTLENDSPTTPRATSI
jgi:exodeoxyribonuclease VII large subunit